MKRKLPRVSRPISLLARIVLIGAPLVCLYLITITNPMWVMYALYPTVIIGIIGMVVLLCSPFILILLLLVLGIHGLVERMIAYLATRKKTIAMPEPTEDSKARKRQGFYCS